MFVRVKSTPNSPRQAVQIVQSVREGDKVRQKILRHVGVAMNDAELVKLKEVAYSGEREHLFRFNVNTYSGRT